MTNYEMYDSPQILERIQAKVEALTSTWEDPDTVASDTSKSVANVLGLDLLLTEDEVEDWCGGTNLFSHPKPEVRRAAHSIPKLDVDGETYYLPEIVTRCLVLKHIDEI